MKLDFNLPILARKRAKGVSTPSDVYCSIRHSSDVPEISLSEMSVVFEVFTRHMPVPTDGTTKSVMHDACGLGHASPFVMRVFEGQLYRKVARSLEEAEELLLFNKAFDAELSGRLESHMPRENGNAVGWLAEYGGDISPLQMSTGSGPLSRPLGDEFEWQMDRRSTNTLRSKHALPKPSQRGVGIGWHAHRNDTFINDFSAANRALDEADVAAALELITAQADRLVIADGEVWIKSRPPAFRVQMRPSAYRGPPSEIEIAMVTAPDSYVGDLLTSHISLFDEEEAVAQAMAYYGKADDWGYGYGRKLLDYRVPFTCHDDTILDYDYQSEEINRVGYTAAVECTAFLERNPRYAEKLDLDQISLIKEAYTAALGSNFLMDQHADMTPFIGGLAVAWKKLGYKQILTGGESLSYWAETALKRATRYVEDMPIRLDISSPSFKP